MTDPETRAFLADYKAKALASFPLSRVTRAFHDAMLNALPPVHIRAMAGFIVSEAATEDVHAQFVDAGRHCYGAYIELSKPETWITRDAINCFEAESAYPKTLEWYPEA